MDLVADGGVQPGGVDRAWEQVEVIVDGLVDLDLRVMEMVSADGEAVVLVPVAVQLGLDRRLNVAVNAN